MNLINDKLAQALEKIKDAGKTLTEAVAIA